MSWWVDWWDVVHRPDVYGIYGPPAGGKSNLAIALAQKDVSLGRNVNYIITEANLKPIADKVPGAKLALSIGDFENAVRSVKSLGNTTLVIDSLGAVYRRVIRQAWLERGEVTLYDVREAIMIVRDAVDTLIDIWAVEKKPSGKLVFILHESPAIGESFYGYPWPKPRSVVNQLQTIVHTGCTTRTRLEVGGEGGVEGEEYVYRTVGECFGVVVMARFRELIRDAFFRIPTPRLL
jgi:hypothetical protein